MPLKANKVQVNIPMTKEQKAALEVEAARQGVKMTDLVRQILTDAIPQFPDNMPGMGGYDRTQYKCIYCDNVQYGNMECQQCGEEEFEVVD